ncbi:MAG: hypothetical protein ACK5QC_07475 [Bacteroidota bacterium]|jgi:hypothetical protein
MKTTKQLLIAMLMIINQIDLSAAKKEPNVINAVKNSLILPTHYFENKHEKEVRLSFKINEEGKAQEIIINAETESEKVYLLNQLSKMKFKEKGNTINLLLRFKLM